MPTFESQSGNRAESASVEVKKKPDTRAASTIAVPENIGWEDKGDEIAAADLGLVQIGRRESAKGRVKTGSSASAVVELRKPVPPAARPSERTEHIKPAEVIRPESLPNAPENAWTLLTEMKQRAETASPRVKARAKTLRFEFKKNFRNMESSAPDSTFLNKLAWMRNDLSELAKNPEELKQDEDYKNWTPDEIGELYFVLFNQKPEDVIISRQGKAPEVPESKVAFSPEITREINQRKQAAEEQQAQQKIEGLRQQFGTDFNVEKVLQRSNTERALAGEAMRAFKERLDAGALTSQDVRRIGLELTSVRDNLEGLQTEARTVAKKEMLVQSMKDNYGVLDEINKFIYACSLENPKDAAAHLKYETPEQKRKDQKHLVNVEQMKETNPGTIAAQIESKYGYHPEDLRSGNVKGLKGWFAGLKFRMKDRFSHLTGTPSEYDEYRQALNLAPARPEIKLKPEEEVMEVKEGEYMEVPAPPAKILKETAGAVKEAMFDAPISIAEAQGLVAYPDKLWDLANKAIAEHPSAKTAILASSDENQVGGVATNYVLAIAKYMRAKEYPADQKTITRLKKTVDNFNEMLGLAGNAQVQASMLHRPEVKNVMRGPATRQAATKRSEQRWLRP